MSLFLNLLFESDSYSNEYLLAAFGVDTAENELCKVCPLSVQQIPQVDLALLKDDALWSLEKKLRDPTSELSKTKFGLTLRSDGLLS